MSLLLRKISDQVIREEKRKGVCTLIVAAPPLGGAGPKRSEGPAPHNGLSHSAMAQVPALKSDLRL